jgi:hypothetical protein
MSFGLTNAPTYFMYLMNSIFFEELDVFVVILLSTVKFRQPSHEFTFDVGITFVSYSLVLTPMV